MNKLKILVAIPSCRDWKVGFGSALVGLVHKSALEGLDFTVHIMQGASVIPRARQLAVEFALNHAFTHILFLDDDMVFPPTLIDQLKAEDRDVIGVNYVRKGFSPTPLTHGLDGEMVSSKDKIGTQEVGWIGFGAVLIKLAAIKDIPAPLFEQRWMDDRKDFIGEDFYFCGKVRAHDIKVHLSHDASQEVSHIGDYSFREIA